MEACGLPVARTPRAEQWTRASVLDVMLTWKKQNGLLPTSVQWRLTGDGHPCSTTVWRLWGSFSAALEAAEAGGVTETPEDALERHVMEAVAAAFDETVRTPAERLAALRADLAMLAPDEVVLGCPFTRWRSRETGELLVAIAAKDDDGIVSVLPITGDQSAHPFDWMPEAVFLRTYEAEPVPG